MKRFIATSANFRGEIVIAYDFDGKLVLIDFQNAELSPEQIDFFKSHVPVFFNDNFVAAFGKARLHFVEESYEVTFEMFWNRYGKKINQKRCIVLWDKLSKANKVKCYFGIAAYFKYLDSNTWRSKADPETYLSKQYWLTDWRQAA